MIERMNGLKFEAYPSLKAFFGANGVLTGEIKSDDEFRALCLALFGVAAHEAEPMKSIEDRIKAIGKAKRRVLVRRNLGNLPARLVSQKTAHQRKRKGVLSKRDKKTTEAMQKSSELNAEFRSIVGRKDT